MRLRGSSCKSDLGKKATMPLPLSLSNLIVMLSHIKIRILSHIAARAAISVEKVDHYCLYFCAVISNTAGTLLSIQTAR